MYFKSINREITMLVLVTFLVVTIVPGKGHGIHIQPLTDKEAIFGWCKLKRLRKKTKVLVKLIEEYKRGKKTVEEVTIKIASLERTASKTFKKNYKVRKIMERANRKIEEFMHSLLDSKQRVGMCGMYLAQQSKEIDRYDLQNCYESIQVFLRNLQDYEDNNATVRSLREEFKFINEVQKLQKLSHSGNDSKNGHADVESKILFAYVSVFCGCLLSMIPTPFTRAAGSSLISGGLYVICESEWVDLDESNKKGVSKI